MKTAMIMSKWMMAGALAFTSFSAFAESGEGRNGPDKSGVSIPVSVDRMVTIEAVEKAGAVCHKQQGRLLLSQIIRKNISASQIRNSAKGNPLIRVGNGKESQCIIISGFALGVQDSFYLTAFSFQSDADLMYQQPECLKAPEILITQSAFEAVDRLTVTSDGYTGGVHFSYEVKKDSQYDELGNDLGWDALVSSIKVTSEDIYRTQKDGTKIKVKLQGDAEEFKQCLQTQLGQ